MPEESVTEKENIILEAARNRFAYYGFSKVTMDEIAADIGMAKASLYYYYPTKERLFQAVVGREQGKFIRTLEGVIRQKSTACEKLHEYAVRRFGFFRDFVNFGAPGNQSFGEVKHLSGDLFKSFEQQELRILHQILQAGNASGEFSVQNPHHASELLLHALHGLRLRTMFVGHDLPPDDRSYGVLKKETESLIAVFIDGIRNRESTLRGRSWK